MGKRDKNGKQLNFFLGGGEKIMVKNLKSQGLLPNRPVLQARSCVERLGKNPMEGLPETNVTSHDPFIPHTLALYPVADVHGASSSSQVGSRITPKMNSVIVVPIHDEERGMDKLKWGDKVFLRNQTKTKWTQIHQ